jgi:hypothetical protein
MLTAVVPASLSRLGSQSAYLSRVILLDLWPIWLDTYLMFRA